MERGPIDREAVQCSDRRQFLAGVGTGLVALGAGMGPVGGRAQESAVTVRLDNVGAIAWELAAADEEQVGDVGAQNPTLTLTVGTRYRFVNGGGSGHPLEFRDEDRNPLLSQATRGEFENRAGVDWTADDDAYEYAFTVTEALAERLDTYWCTFHSSMRSGIETVQPEPAAAVEFADQSTTGTAVTVDSVRMDDGGFLTIHDSRLLDDQPVESVRGVSEALDPGETEDVTVSLDDPLTGDDTLIAMPHRDDPADGAYRFVESGADEDPPYLDQDGEAVLDAAEVTVDGADVTVSLNNVSAEAWEVTDADSGVAPTGAENPTLRLRVGTRYAVENGGWDVHPLAFRDAGDAPLLTQSGDGAFADDDGVNWVDDGSALSFTVTEDLAAELDDYVCTVHPSMEGDVETLAADAPAAGVTMADQESDGESVVVDSVRMDDGGFLAIHDSRLLDGQPIESVRGVSEALDPGVYGNLEVALDDPLTGDDTLIAMPHRDDPADGTYRFVESGAEEDPPYVDGDGNAVVDDAAVSLPDDGSDGGADGDSTGDDDGAGDDSTGDDGTDSDDGTDGTDDGSTDAGADDGGGGDEDAADDTADDGGPGFGPVAGAAGVGSLAAYALRKLQLQGDPPAAEEDLEEDRSDGE